jgi:DNA-directed RNA polymerase specialized sigma24 family protein
MSGADSESSLVRRAVAGDRAALSQLLLVHFDDLHRHVESRISPQLQGLMRADDILQQTFLRAAQAIGTFELRHACFSQLAADHRRQPGARRGEASAP